MDIKEIFPADGRYQDIYCPVCKQHCDLAYVDFIEELSGVNFSIFGLPVLKCPSCGTENLPDRSRFLIIDSHKKSVNDGSLEFVANRRKIVNTFSFTSVPFQYDPDDYHYIPGLQRPWDEGFLTPVFFKRSVLLKYDNAPGYRVKFASTTYGTIYTDDSYISFGINRHGNVMMWLGDIGKLPEAEQFYLRSENLKSDHSIGSEFYDGQIECVATKRSRESELFKQRSDLIEACFKHFGEKIARLDSEVLDLAISFNPPTVDTPKERRHVADTLNKIYIESMDNGALGRVFSAQGRDLKSLGSLKRLQGILESALKGESVASQLSPLYVLYDLRVAYSHLHSSDAADLALLKVTDRLGLPAGAGLLKIYDVLMAQLTKCFQSLTNTVGRLNAPH